jgi:plasmid stabilization system protein ParE
MAEIRWTQEAATWLEDIHRYIAQDSPSAAGRVIQGLYEKIQMLSEYPEMGYRYREAPEGTVRVLLYGHYRIAYLFRKDGAVVVLGIFHGALDMDRYL